MKKVIFYNRGFVVLSLRIFYIENSVIILSFTLIPKQVPHTKIPPVVESVVLRILNHVFKGRSGEEVQ